MDHTSHPAGASGAHRPPGAPSWQPSLLPRLRRRGEPEPGPETWRSAADGDPVCPGSGQARSRTSWHLDFLTFVPDGEPTLDIHLGEAIERLRPLGVPIAVISNGSLLWRTEVRDALRRADWVSLKVDAAREHEWRRINRPHPALRLGQVIEGMLAFVGEFAGRLATETMLVHRENDAEDSVED